MRHLALLVRILLLSAFLPASAKLAEAAPAPEASLVRRLAALPSASEPRVTFGQSVTNHLATATSLGHLAAATRIEGMSLIVKRTPEQEASLDQLLRDQQDPHSPSYHHWLTPQTFADRFGLASADVDILTAWLRAQGFQVTEVAPSRNRIVFSGTAGQIEAAFSTTLHRYKGDGQSFFENSNALQLPQPLAAVVSGISGLSSYRLHRHAIRSSVPVAKPQYTTPEGVHVLVPWDFRQLFDINPLISSGSDGTGVKIGVIGQSAFSSAQVSDFQLKTGQTTKLPNAVLVPNTGVSNLVAGDEDESEIDLEYATGTAPGASVQFIYTGCTAAASSTALPDTTDCQNDGVFSALIYSITNNLAPILTLSYGSCEAKIATYAASTLEPVLKQADAQGQTILVSSGDSGPATCDQGTDARAATQGLTVSYPASSAYVTAVGGTQLSDNGFSSTNNSYGGSATTYSSEQAWNDTAQLGTLTASGGGVSKLFTKPEWQVGQFIPSDGFRDVPDVAFPGSVLNVPYFACTAEASCQADTTIGGTSTTSNGGAYGGTSLSTPNFAAMLAVIEQKNGTGPLGNINPELYALAQGASASTVFHDVGGKDNFVPCVLGTPDCGESNQFLQIGYGTGAGYDQVTGFGSISATGLAATLASSAPVVSLTVAPNPPIVDEPVTFTAAVLSSVHGAAPTGSVTFSVDGNSTGVAVPLNSGSASFTYSGFTSPGQTSGDPHVVTATYSGDSTYTTGGASLNMIATQVPASVSIAVSSSQIQINTPVQFKITASGPYGTPTGYILLSLDGGYLANTVSPLVLVNGVATYSYAGFTMAGVHEITAQYYSPMEEQSVSGTDTGPAAPYTPYVVGQATTDLEVSASSQTLAATISLTTATTGVLAPTDPISYAVAVQGNGSVAPTGGLTLTFDGTSSQERFITPTASGFTDLLNFGLVHWSPGTHTVQVAYNGDNNYKPTAPVTASFTVVLPSFTISASPATLNIPGGSSGSTILTVNGNPTYSGQTVFQLSLLSYTGAPFSGCYGLSSNDVVSQRSTPVTVTLTMYSGTSQCSSGNRIGGPLSAAGPHKRDLLPMSFASILFVGCLAFRRRRFAAGLLLLFLSATLLASIGCGSAGTSDGGSGGTGTGGTGTGGGGTGGGGGSSSVPSGSYVLQVTGIGGLDDTATSKATFTLNVQ